MGVDGEIECLALTIPHFPLTMVVYDVDRCRRSGVVPYLLAWPASRYLPPGTVGGLRLGMYVMGSAICHALRDVCVICHAI